MSDPGNAFDFDDFDGDDFNGLDGLVPAGEDAGRSIDLGELDELLVSRTTQPVPVARPRRRKNSAGLIAKGEKARKAKRWVEAAKYLNEAWYYEQNNISIVKALADVLANLGARSKAIDLYLYALQRAPQDTELAGMAGQVAIDMELWDEAEKLNAAFVELEPTNPVGYVNRATALRKLERFDEAIDMLQQVLPILPESADLWNVLGSVVNMRDDLDAAMPFYDEALRLEPKAYKTLNNLARALNDLGRYDEAVPYAAQAYKNTDDKNPVVHFTLAMAQLGAGQLSDAWESYACRLDKRRQDAIRYALKVPYLSKGSLKGKKVIVVPEQGVGDEILFLSALPDLLAEAESVAGGCDWRLVSIIKRSFPQLDVVSAYADTYQEGYRIRLLPDVEDGGEGYDGYIPIADLFCRYRPSVQSFRDAKDGFLVTDADVTAKHKAWLDGLGPELKVGICWRSGLQKAERNFWYADLAFWEPILKTKGARFINLQYGDCDDEIAEFKSRFGVDIEQCPDLNLKDELDEAASLTDALDLVISIGAQPAMSAFAVDKPIFWLFPFPPWWNFGERTHAPMHARSQFFMGDEPMDWTGAAQKAADALAKVVSG